MERQQADQSFLSQLAGFSLTTAEILYHLPDHPSLLQSYVWQDYVEHPRFPKLRSFLDFWQGNIEGRLHTVRVAHRGLIAPAEIPVIDGEFRLN
ncbi:MAG: usg protein [Pseudomonadota bacterium]